MKKLTIRYGKVKLNPGLRNLLRIICLLADFNIEFKKDCNNFILLTDDKEICFPIGSVVNDELVSKLINIENTTDLEDIIYSKKEYEFDLLTLIYESYLGNKIDLVKKYLWILFKIIIFRFEVNSTSKVEYEELSAIIDDMISYSNSYFKEKEPFKDKKINELWDKHYGYLSRFSIVGNCTINKINKAETKEYERLFKIAKTGVESIDNAIQTLLELLPEDAERILDIGSGPGYVNRNISPCYNVLAMDIEESILKDNIRKCCIGDLLNIPLEDKSVEMSMACDVLEHIEKNSLNKAISELERVSTKYIYIQVPFDEYLGQSVAKCGCCGNTWHVNYHKNSFNYKKIIGLLGDQWKVSKIAFTGEITEYGTGEDAGKLLDNMDVEHYDVEQWKCPDCGSNTVRKNKPYLEIADEIEKTFNNNNPICRYSEIAILFERISNVNSDEQSCENIKDFDTINLNTANLMLNDKNILRKSNDYIKDTYTPYYISNDFDVEFLDDGMHMTKKVEGNGCISFIIPITFAKDNKILEISGKSIDKINFVFCGIDLNENEYKIAEEQCNQNEFQFTINIDGSIRSTYGFIKIYADNSFRLNNIKVKDEVGKNYVRYISKSDTKHLCKRINNTDVFWFIPSNKYIDMPEDLNSWLNGSLKQLKNNEIVFDYIKLLYGRIFELANSNKLLKNKEEKIINDYVGKRLNEVILINEELKNKLSEKDYYISILNEQLTLNVTRMQELEAQANLYREFAVNLSKSEKGNHRAKKILLKVVRKIIKILKKIAKTPLLYDLLISIGAKKVYNKIKIRVKGENKYE